MIYESLTFEVKTFLCPICGEKMRVLAPFVPDKYIQCHKCSHEMPTSPESEVVVEI